MRHFIICSIVGIGLLTACNKNQSAAPAVSYQPVRAAPMPKVSIPIGNPQNAKTAINMLALSGNDQIKFDNFNINDTTATFNNIKLSGPDDTEFKAQKMMLFGLDTKGESAHFGRLAMVGLEADLGPEFGKVTLGSFDIVNPSQNILDFLSAVAKGEDVKDVVPQLSAVTFDRVRATKLKFSIKTDSARGRFSVDAMGLDGHNDGLAASMIFGGVKFSGQAGGNPMRVSMDRLNILNHNVVNGMAQRRKTAPNQIDRGFDAIMVSNLDFITQGVKISSPAITYGVERRNDGAVKSSFIKPSSISISSDKKSSGAAGFEQVLQLIGMDKLELVYASKSEISNDNKTINYNKKNNYIDIKGLAKLSLGMGLVTSDSSGNSKTSGDPDSVGTKLMKYVDASALTGLEFSLQNTGGLQRALTIGATLMGTDLKGLSGMLQAQGSSLVGGASAMNIDPAIAQDILNAAVSFVRKPKTLTLKMQPARPISLDPQSAGKGLTKSRLGFTASNR